MAIILHLDLDAFFASCEHARRDIDGAVVVTVTSDRGEDAGAVSAADYDAREYGIHAGMPIRQAKAYAEDVSDVVFLEADKAYYQEMSESVMGIVRERVDKIEVASIDEAYGDVTSLDSYAAAERVARELQARIQEEVGVTASVGIGPNKLIAKMASDRDKPAGITRVEPAEVDGFVQGLPVDELYGVGPKTAERLADMDVEMVDDLQEVSAQRLVRAFGEAKGISLHEKAYGRGETELEEQQAKQLSRLTTLEADTRDMAEIRPVIREMAGAVMERVDGRGWRYRTVTALMVTSGHDMRSRSRSVKTATDSLETLYSTAEELVEAFLDQHPDVSLRRVGVRASGFDRGGQETLAAFG